MRRALVTGGAGFIGSNLADRLLADGVEVVVFDNLSTGRREFVPRDATLVESDVLDPNALAAAIEGCDTVFHLQANADVRHGLERPRVDLEQNTIGTSNVLEAMRAAGATTIAFASTGSVYGEPEVFPTPEDAPFPIQTSLYAASKLAGEGLIGAYAHGFGIRGLVFRFVSILGERYTHGHVIEFYRALRADPSRLRVLGDGRQRKSYLYVQDCVGAMLTALRAHESGFAVYNLGTDESITVDESIGVITSYLGVSPALEHTGGTRGWAGDSPLIHLDTAKIRALGWAPSVTIREAVVKTLEWLDERDFSRAPLRISLGGGGTDLPSYYREHGGFLVSAAIDKYVYMLTHTVFQRRYRLKYSQFEEVDDPQEIRHPILREVLVRHWRGEPLEIASVADVPAGTGMGSSGAYTVCLLKALALARHTTLPPRELAEAACEIEIDVLKEPVGKQDQYVAAHGGVCAYTFNPDDTVTVEPLELDPDTLRRMSSNLLLFYTGESRSASALLADQNRRTHQQENSMLENLHRTKEMGLESRVLLEAGDLDRYAELMHEHWQNKRERSPGMANENIDRLYTLARRSGVVGGKLVGAGGGGFLLVYASRPDDTRQAMRAAGVQELRFELDFMGAIGEERGMKVGIVGCGLIGRKRAAVLGQDELVAAYDPVATLEPAVDSVEAVLDAADAVIVATPHDTLAELTVAALEAGKHVLVEKPAGIGTTDIRAIAAAAECAGTHVHVGFNHRFHPAIARAVDEARSGEHGEILHVRARYGHGGRPGYDREWRADPARSGGGELIDQGMHLLDLSHWLLGPLPLHSALLRTQFWDAPVEDNAVLILGERDAGPWTLFHVSWTEWKNLFSLEIYCRAAKLQVDGLARSYGPQRLTRYLMRPELGPPDVDVIDYPAADASWAAEWLHFRRAVAAGEPPTL